VLKSISTTGGPPAFKEEGHIEDAVAAMELLVHMVSMQLGELYISIPTAKKLHKVQDKEIKTSLALTKTSLALTNWENTVLYIKKDAVWSLRMKS